MLCHYSMFRQTWLSVASSRWMGNKRMNRPFYLITAYVNATASHNLPDNQLQRTNNIVFWVNKFHISYNRWPGWNFGSPAFFLPAQNYVLAHIQANKMWGVSRFALNSLRTFHPHFYQYNRRICCCCWYAYTSRQFHIATPIDIYLFMCKNLKEEQ